MSMWRTTTGIARTARLDSWRQHALPTRQNQASRLSVGFAGPTASVVLFTSTTDRPPEPRRRRPAGTYDRRILRCTKKRLHVIRPEQLATQGPDDEDWYANLLVLDRRKCLFLTHAGTLFTIFEPDVRASDLRATKNLVVELIERELLPESLPADVFGDL